MNVSDVIDLGREAVLVTLLISSPLLISSLVVGLVVGLFQTLTQIQEQTVAFVPKIVVMVLALSVALPWLVNQMIEYSRVMIESAPTML